MKRYGLLLALLILGCAFLGAQPYAATLFFSEYVEGSSYNKALEIFNGTGATVDLSQYTIKVGYNGGPWSTNIYAPTGNLAHSEVLVVANPQASTAILAIADFTSGAINFNGDDCVGLFLGDTLIDVIGLYLEDPGTAWPVAGVADATANHTLIRKPTVVQGNLDWAEAAGTNADNSEWIVEANDYTGDLGSHTFDPAGGNNVATPVFTPGGGVYTEPVSVAITCATAGAEIYYTTDGSTPTPSSLPYTGPITVSVSTTLKARAVLPGMDDSNVATAIYTFPITMANIAALRLAQPGNIVYQLTGEAVLTFQQASRNQKYIQDASAAIVIDDPSGTITTEYALYDGITGILGTLGDYANLIQFTPLQDPGPATSSGNVVVPELRTLASLIPADQAKLIKVLDVTIDPALVNFPAAAANIDATDPTTTLTLRTFPNAEYSDTPIPTAAVNLICLVGQYNDGMQISPRFLADFSDPATDVEAPVFSHPSGDYTASFDLIITCATPGAQIYYTLDGSEPDQDSTAYSSPIAISATTTVKAIAYLGTYFSPVNTAVYVFPTSADDPGVPLLQTALLGNFPNPFNPSTSIVFSLKEAGPVHLNIYNLKGQHIRGLLNGTYPAGRHSLSWDGKDDSGNKAGSGIYYYRMDSGKYTDIRKMLMLK